MAKREYAFYPGCSSQLRGSAANYLVSVESMCEKLDVKMTQIPDWNCCGASISYAEARANSRGHVLSARNFALSDKHLPGQDIVATCAACWLGGRETIEKLDAPGQLLADTNEALKEAGLQYKPGTEIRHMVEVLVEDLGYEELGKPVVKAARRRKGCRLRRLPDQPPLRHRRRIVREPMYLDKLIETVGGEPIPKYEGKVSCCGGSLAFCEPERRKANQEHRRVGLRSRRRCDLHPLPAVPGQRRGLSIRDQQEAGHQTQNAGGLLQPAIERRLRRYAQGSQPRRPHHPAEEAAGYRGQGSQK